MRFGYFTVVCLVSAILPCFGSMRRHLNSVSLRPWQVAIVLGFFAADIVWRVTRPAGVPGEFL